MRSVLVTGIVFVACLALFYFSFRKDRSRYRNCYFLIMALGSFIPFLLNITGHYADNILPLIVQAFLLCVLIVPFFLIYNGITMIRREGRHLQTMLSLAFGITILAGEVILIAGMMRYTSAVNAHQEISRQNFWNVASAVFCMTVMYGSVSFLVFMIYTLFLQIIPRQKDFDYVIIHGAGLLDGHRISKLLKDRLDKAVEVYYQDPTPPVLIPSGGKGSDETIAEAEAMKQYLLEQGIPEKDIIPENRSTTTMENLQYSKEILDGFEGRKYTALVSSNYHIYRALRYCREIGMKCTGIGSHVALYYWPSALIREYIAIHVERKHALMFVGGWVFCLVLLLTGVYL